MDAIAFRPNNFISQSILSTSSLHVPTTLYWLSPTEERFLKQFFISGMEETYLSEMQLLKKCP